ncbi:hypothetical protein QAD02_005072 [Eretmocerus hayati]|uniref:Uncharacterized protein n=2 Tax=Eretmocerus hayati TaxID=131215 RepID=A0ACC2NRA3_9HYME|nr:hypothetical protein QAD02_008724 [Eretmocerus hayati]KAJ8673810.1 hypothetical protein QAD02_005072 [Eretmocerus hayati]
MPVVPAEVYALAKNYWTNECNDTELMLLEYVKTHRALRQARERAATCKKKKEEEQFRTLKKLFREKSIQDERENEISSLGGIVPVPATPINKPAAKRKQPHAFPLKNTKRGPRRTLSALKSRLSQLSDPGAVSCAPPGVEVEQPPRESESIPAASDHRLVTLHAELSPHLLISPASAGAADGGGLAVVDVSPAPEVVSNPREMVRDVDTAQMNVSFTCEDAQRHFASTYTDVCETLSVLGGPITPGVIAERAEADSTLVEEPGAVSTPLPTIYEIPRQQLWEPENRLINPFQLLNEIAPMHGTSSAVDVTPSGHDHHAQLCDDDDLVSTLIRDMDAEHPGVRIRITRRPSASHQEQPHVSTETHPAVSYNDDNDQTC